ncbi:MAG: Mpo1-like protein [Deltaproteobacteria bacterium]
MQEPIGSFQDFWPFYLGEHRRALTRRLHFIGTSGTLLFALAAALTGRPALLLGALVSGYGFAWVSHFAVEKNRPATFRYPFYSLAGDFKMYGLILTGRMDAELARLLPPPPGVCPPPGA